MDLTGFGIDNQEGDNNNPIVHVDVGSKKAWVGADSANAKTFDEIKKMTEKEANAWQHGGDDNAEDDD